MLAGPSWFWPVIVGIPTLTVLMVSLWLCQEDTVEETVVYDIPQEPMQVFYSVAVLPRQEEPSVSAVLFPEEKPDYWMTIRVRTTGYSPHDKVDSEYHRKYPSTKTAAQVDWRKVPHGIAVDKRLLPYGTSVRIPGYGCRTVDDTGKNVRKSYRKGVPHLDLRFHSESEASRWGVRWVDIDVNTSKMTEAQRNKLRAYEVTDDEP